MNKKQHDSDPEEDVLSVEELESRLESQPDNIDLKEELAAALFNRCLDEETERETGHSNCLERLGQLVEDLPEASASYYGAYLAYIEGEEEKCINQLTKFASVVSRKVEAPYDSDELFYWLIGPFGFEPRLWERVANGLSQGWSESAAELTLRGLARLGDDESSGDAIDYFVRALDQDQAYWLAAQGCADAYFEEGNWRAARNYYHKALGSETIKEYPPDIYFALAECARKLKDYQEEEQYYRSCLEFAPDYRYARNNLGWALYRQGRYEEALEIFDEAIERGNDGRYPLRNKARTLVKLGRLSEAIETLEQDIYRCELTKSAQSEIYTLQAAIGGQEKGRSLPRLDIEDLEDEAEEGEAVAYRDEEESFAAPGERWLERMLEEQIEKDQQAFGRRLRIYYHSDGYGRQFPIAGVGRIDLLAEDTETDALVVIELKQGKSDDQVIGQISRYMTWVRENLAQPGQEVLGIVCVRRASKNLRLSAKNIHGLEVFEYGLTLRRNQ